MVQIRSRFCVCGHKIVEHEDYDFDIHECNHRGCDCKQFKDTDDSGAAAGDEQGEKK